MNKDNIEFVRENYKHVAKQYRDTKDATQSQIPLFVTWLNRVSNVLELGCATGFPIGKSVMEQGKQYIGIDLSPEHIQMAREEFPQWADNFQEAEMLEFVKSQPDETYDGIVSMFSIRHLPRIHHVELFENIKRILKPGGLFLVDHPRYSDEGRDTWFDNKPMYWSSFSDIWQKLTLKEIGFVKLEEFEDIKIFNGEEERTLFIMYQV